jgi:hypothetical protein
MPDPVPTRRRFRLRAFVSLSLFGSFIAASTAGLALYLRPEGSLAAWSGWHFLGIDKKGWEGVHTIFVGLLFVLGAVHVILNRKALLAHLRSRAGRLFRAPAELGAAILLLALFLGAALFQWPPLWSLMDVRSDIKSGHYSVKIPPPAPEAEKLGLTDICALAGISIEKALARLDAAGIRAANPKATLAALAKASGSTPERIYEILSRKGE